MYRVEGLVETAIPSDLVNLYSKILKSGKVWTGKNRRTLSVFVSPALTY